MENINMFGIGGVAAIVVICLLVGMIVKAINGIDNKWIPVICGLAGAVLGVVGMHIMPDFPAQDVVTAAAVGIVSGLGATGVHQAVKQLGEGGE
jgi:hypothetical protein